MADQTTKPAEVIANIPIKWDGDKPVSFLVDEDDAELIVKALTEAGFVRPLPDDETRQEVEALVVRLENYPTGVVASRLPVAVVEDIRLAAAYLTEGPQG